VAGGGGVGNLEPMALAMPNSSESLSLSQQQQGQQQQPGSPDSQALELAFNAPHMPDHSNDNFLAAFSNLESYEVSDSGDEEEERPPWWDGVYGTKEGDQFDMEEELLDACEDGDLQAVLDLVGDDYQKSNVNLDCLVPVGAPEAPKYSRSRRTVVYRQQAFHIACANGRLDIVDYLIEREECKFDVVDIAGLNPLISACIGGWTEVVKLLVKTQRVPNMMQSVDLKGWNSLMHAVDRGYFELCKFLVTQTFRKKIDLNQRNEKGETAAKLAAARGYKDILEMMVSRGKLKRRDVSSGDENGNTCLHASCNKGHFEVVKFLVEKMKVDIDVTDNHNRTGLYFAAVSGHEEIVRYLAGLNADLTISYAFSYTAQEIALKNGFKEIGVFLRDLQRQKNLERKARIEADNARTAGVDAVERKHKLLLEPGEMKLVKEFLQGRKDINIKELDEFDFSVQLDDERTRQKKKTRKKK